MADDDDDYGILSIYNKMKQGMFGLIYIMAKSTNHSYNTILLYNIIEFFQILSFLFPMHYFTTYNLKIYFGWQDYTDWLGYFSNCFRIVSYIQLTDIGMIISFSVTSFLILMLICVSLFAIIEYQFVSFKDMIIVKLLRHLTEFLFGPLYIPILSFLLRWIVCSPGFKDSIGCWTVKHNALFIISVIMGILYILLGILFSSTFYSRDPTSPSHSARPHSRIQIWQTIINSLYVISYILAEAADSSQWLMVVLILIGSLITSYLYYTRLPYYNWDFNILIFLGSCVHTWTSLCVGVNIIFRSASNSVSMLHFLVLPLILYYCYTTMERRKIYLRDVCKVSDMSNETEVELKARFVLEHVTKYLRLRNNEFGLYLNQNAHKFELGYSYHPLSSHPKSDEEHESTEAEHFASLQSAEIIYADGIRRFPVSMMALLRSEYCFCYKKEIASALHTLTKAEHYGPVFDESYTIFALRLTYAELDYVNQRDIQSYLSWQSNQMIASREDEKASNFQLRFWTELMVTSPDLGKLHDLSVFIHESMSTAHEAFKKLMKLNPSSENVLRSYASFLIDVMNRPDEANSMLRRADELEDAAARSHKDNEAIGNDLLSDRMAIISITSSPDRLGEIIDVNTGAVRLTGHSRGDLLNSNVNRIIPAPIAAHHNAILKLYLDTGNSRLMNTNNFTISLHKNGYLAPFEFYLREISASQLQKDSDQNESDDAFKSTTFIAVLKPASFNISAVGRLGPNTAEDISRISSSMKIEFMMVDSTFNIISLTAGCGTLFGINIEIVRQGVKCSSLIQNFDDIIQDLQKADDEGIDIKVIIQPDNHIIEVKCCVKYVHVFASEYYYLVKFIIQPNLVSKCHNLATKNTSSQNVTGFDPNKFALGTTDADLNLGIVPSSIIDDDLSNFPSVPLSVSNYMQSPFVTTPVVKLDNSNSSKFQFNFGFDSDDIKTEVSESKLQNIELISPSVNNNNRHNASEGRSNGSGTASNATSMHARLNSFSLISQTQGLGQGLRKLMGVLIVSIVLVCLLAIVKYVVFNSMYDTFLGMLNDSYYAARERFLVARIVLYVRTLLFTPKDNGFQGFISTSQAEFYRTLLSQDITELRSINDLLINERGSSLSTEHYKFWIDPQVALYYQNKIGGNMVLSTETSSLWDAAKLYLFYAQDVFESNLGTLFDNNPSVFFILKNGYGPFLNYLNESTFLYNTEATGFLDKMYIVIISLTIVSIFIMLFLIVIFVKPAVWMIEDNKHEVLLLFTEIPLKIIQEFKTRTEERLLRIHRDKEIFLKEGVDAENNIDETANENMNEEEKNNDVELLQNDVEQENEPLNTNDLSNKINDNKVKDITRSVRGDGSKTIGSRHWTFLKISTILWAAVLYFGVTYSTDYSMHSQELYSSPYEINWSQYRNMQYGIVIDQLRQFSSQNISFGVVDDASNFDQISASNISDSINFMLDIQNSLSLDDPRRHTYFPVGIQKSIMFSSASCVAVPDLYTPTSDCTTFHNGLMNNGIHDAVLLSGDIFRDALASTAYINFTDYYVVNATLNNEFMNNLNNLQEYQLHNLFAYSRLLAHTHAENSVNDLVVIRMSVLIVFVIINSLMFIFYFYPLIYELNFEQKRTITFLLLIPANVMEKMHSIRTFVEKLASDTNATG